MSYFSLMLNFGISEMQSFAKQVDKMSFLQKLSENKKESATITIFKHDFIILGIYCWKNHIQRHQN